MALWNTSFRYLTSEDFYTQECSRILAFLLLLKENIIRIVYKTSRYITFMANLKFYHSLSLWNSRSTLSYSYFTFFIMHALVLLSII